MPPSIILPLLGVGEKIRKAKCFAVNCKMNEQPLFDSKFKISNIYEIEVYTVHSNALFLYPFLSLLFAVISPANE